MVESVIRKEGFVMKKLASVVAGFAALAFIAAPAMPAMAYEATDVKDGAVTVKDAADLKQALDDTTVKTITLGADINLDSSAVIDEDGVTLNGADHTIAVPGGKDPVGGSNYAIKIYADNVVIKDVKTAGEAVGGIQVAGENVKLEGDIVLGAHEWGGIELKAPADMTKANITFASENATTPAIWSDEADMTAKTDSVKAAVKAQKEGKDTKLQLFLYVDAKNAPAADAEGFVSVETLDVDSYRVSPIEDETPEVTPPVEDETKGETEAEVEAPNTGTVVTNAALVVTSIAAAVVAAAYAVRFAGARK